MENKKKRKKKEVDQVSINTAVAFVVVTASLILFAMVASRWILQHEFERAEAEFFEGFTMPSTELWDRIPNLYIYPWSEYRKYSTRDVPQEQVEFLKGKQVAECMVDMANYDGEIIQDKEAAVSLLYGGVRKLLTDDENQFYVWKEIEIEGIYLSAMVNMKGEIFSFHYVTDMECDEQEAIQYVRDSFEEDEGGYRPLEQEANNFSDFPSNRTLFVKSISEKLIKYENLDTSIFYQDINLTKKPTMNEAKGNAILTYLSETKADYFVFLYLDCKTKKVSGYHLMLY